MSFHPDSNVCISKVGVNRDSDVMGTVCGKKISSALQVLPRVRSQVCELSVEIEPRGDELG